jgi:UDP-N-acetylglucosamine 1-carboxyvinyltransferase
VEVARIIGGRELHGEVSVSGFKNACLPILMACLLTEEECIIENVPNLSDIRLILDILRNVEVNVEYIDTHTIKVSAANVNPHAPMTP